MRAPIQPEPATARRIAMLIYPGVAPLDVAGPLQVFSVANFLRQRKLYEINIVAPSNEPVPTPGGLGLVPTQAMNELELPIDTLLVAGGGGPDAATRSEIGAWLRHATMQSRRFGSICSGAFALAAAGLLEHKRVVTHWACADELARRHPDIQVDVDPIFIRDGNMFSSAGISAGIDLALALVEEDHGRPLAMDIARFLVLPLRRSGGQAQFSPRLRAQFSEVPAIRQTQLWCHDNLNRDLRVSALCRVACMSERDFARKFRQEVGQTPGEYVVRARLEAARGMLTETRLPLKSVAQRCGFRSAAAMRRAFLARVGVPPAQYRTRFTTD